MLFFHLIWLIWAASSGGKLLYAAAAGCGITMPTDLPKTEPVILYAGSSKDAFDIWRPQGQHNQLPVGSRLRLICAGNKNVISALNQQEVELTCRADGKFANGNVKYALDQLGCSSIPTSTLRLTSTPCAKSQGYIYEAGFDIDDDNFATVFTICYNNATEHTYFTYNVINGAAIDYKVIESTRRAFRAEGMRFTTTATNNFYSTKNQIERFVEYFGASQPFLTSTSYLARGHMTPDADFVFSFEQLATYFYANVAPEFQVVNSGNWIRVENLARSLASASGGDLDTYTGVIDQLKLSWGKKKNVPIYIDPEHFMEAPLYYFKVIKHVPTDAAVVMITMNNPFATAADITELCENVCEEAGVANSIFADTSRGYTYCCRLSDFKKIYGDLPAELNAKNLLIANGAAPVRSASARKASGRSASARSASARSASARSAPARKASGRSASARRAASPKASRASQPTTTTGCSITLPTDIPHNEPVYFVTTPNEPTPQLFRPTGQVTVLPTGAELTLACVGSGNNLELLSQQSLVLTCRNDGKFYSSEKSKVFTLAQLNCQRIPTSQLQLTSENCGGSTNAHLLQAGFPLESNFGSVFEICYDKSTESTLYTRSIINGAALNFKIIESTRRSFRADGMRFTTTAVNKYYTQSSQIDVFAQLFGASQSFVTSTSFLARGHMTPDADMVFSYEQLATYFYANVAPEWQIVNSGNWIRVENAARSMATGFGSDLLTFTGTLGVAELPKGKNKMQPIYLDSEKLFPIPNYYYKILMHPQLETSLVMITVNNPFATGKDTVEFCPNVCAEHNLDSPFFTDASRGYTFCCTLDEFEQAVPNLPTFDMPAGW